MSSSMSEKSVSSISSSPLSLALALVLAAAVLRGALGLSSSALAVLALAAVLVAALAFTGVSSSAASLFLAARFLGAPALSRASAALSSSAWDRRCFSDTELTFFVAALAGVGAALAFTVLPAAAVARLAAGLAAGLAAVALALLAALVLVDDLTDDFADFVAGMDTLRAKRTHKENWQAPSPAHGNCSGQSQQVRRTTRLHEALSLKARCGGDHLECSPCGILGTCAGGKSHDPSCGPGPEVLLSLLPMCQILYLFAQCQGPVRPSGQIFLQALPVRAGLTC